MSKTAIIIPARYSSKRLPGKPLLKVCGKPIIQWVWERAVQVKSADMVIIATDNQEIYDCAKYLQKQNHIYRFQDCQKLRL